MKLAATISRILIGLLFVFAGISPFIFGAPSQSGMVEQATSVFYQSHWILFIAAVQLVLGVLFLVNRFVPVALILLAAFLYNSLAFHLLTSPVMLPVPIVFVGLWLLIALQYRSIFAPIFAAKARTDQSPVP